MQIGGSLPKAFRISALNLTAVLMLEVITENPINIGLFFFILSIISSTHKFCGWGSRTVTENPSFRRLAAI